jgi:hypothetical protein
MNQLRNTIPSMVPLTLGSIGQPHANERKIMEVCSSKGMKRLNSRDETLCL